MASNLQFLASHLTIHTPHSQLGRMQIPATIAAAEADDEDDDAISVSSSQAPSQVTTSSQATSQPAHDRRSPRAALAGKRVDNAILTLVECIKDNSAIHDHLKTAEQETILPVDGAGDGHT